MPSKSARLQALIHRADRVLVVLHPSSAAHARIMEQAGCEVGFVGTGGVVGAYTGLSDVGTATMTECVQIAGWIAESVSFPVIVDGATTAAPLRSGLLRGFTGFAPEAVALAVARLRSRGGLSL